ncbi:MULTISPECIES: 3-hydroxyanthranilate 3,4-dioxygenase [Gordonia]|uniref:3-hydroxyanthranilate 3,4-dioxygenase n=2 Tax=Gordonia TaxID=2053 RepID=L7LJ71_9ACTN|nr:MULTISPECIES: 3-hydroxyanthranilate 3,4-dioxygenase [Gordonia]AUH68842.1 3-hydroxyanthranilate 3,4-dioxygenase [Gordonia sp. YC-JH1]KJR10008.1 3-hydroxyanthranilate 3,4-dioxygenase [Gordonia sihwensis]KXT56287.1 3-hydroxyanthranilate 3,4-dioxygenase [Gordonia sp. QH-12]MBY4570578.1 3-hydroxyanthranilate 3,4-dioxygenase [Gordonia sihwensis]GAC60098.1 putative 3-hydroxyanthranilate 3,4-dioxygenase [Gordonia sihwensis NBRC 108236]
MTTIPPVIDFQRWIDDNRHLLKPPVNNQMMALGDDFIIQVVGGPNERYDYHYEPYEEWFYQLRGDIHVNLMTEDGPRRVDVREGETWLMPANIPHSPQRPDPDSIGLVIERVRKEGTLEKFQWYCLECHTKLHEVELQVRDLVEDMPPVFDSFGSDEQARTCRECGALHPGKG